MNDVKKKQVMEYIGEQCRLWRIDNGISLTDVAEYIECSVCNLTLFEKGLRDSMFIFVGYLQLGFDFTERMGGMNT